MKQIKPGTRCRIVNVGDVPLGGHIDGHVVTATELHTIEPERAWSIDPPMVFYTPQAITLQDGSVVTPGVRQWTSIWERYLEPLDDDHILVEDEVLEDIDL